MNAVVPLTGILVGGPVDGNQVTCESKRILTTTETRLLIDNGIKVQTIQGSYIWNESDKTFVWNLESIAFPERPMEDIV